MISIQERQDQIMKYLVDSCSEHLEMYAEGDRIQRILLMTSKMICHEQDMCDHYKDAAERYRKRANKLETESKGIIWD